MSSNRRWTGWEKVTAVLLATFMVFSVAAVVPGVAAGPNSPDSDTTATDKSPTDNTTVPTGDSPLDTAETVLADQPGDANLASDQLDLVRELQAISSESSGADGERALELAEAVLEQRKQWAASPDKPLPSSIVTQFEASQTKLEGARRLLETDEGLQDADALTRAVAKAKEGTKMQAALADDSITMESDLPDVETQDHSSPSAATIALMQRYGATPTAQDVAEMQELDDLPEPTRSALTDYLDAFLAFQRETAEGDFTGTLAARNQLLDETVDLNVALETTESPGIVTPQKDHGDGAIGCGTETAEGNNNNPVGDSSETTTHCILQIDTTSSDNTYTRNTVVLIDDGGNDIYHMNAGGTNLDDDTFGGDFEDPSNPNGAYDENHGAIDVSNPGGNSINKQAPIDNTVDSDVAAALVDFGSGDDDYNRSNAIGFGQRGGAHLGSGFLLDEGGADEYGNSTAFDSHFGTNGGATGNLNDNDDCCRDAVATGFLLDNGSNNGGTDTYNAGSVGANGGAAKGDQSVAGFLIDRKGDSHYRAYSMGTNGGAAEAQAMLVDGGGDDTYEAEAMATNGGALYTSLPGGGFCFPQTCSPGGFLLDAGGSDIYKAASQGTNGGASSQSSGFLFDNGDDATAETNTFQAGHAFDQTVNDRSPAAFDTGKVSQQAGLQGVNGGGFEGGVGVLIETGDDNSKYLAGDGLGSNGGAVVNSAGLIVDKGGNDNYTAGIGYTSGSTFDNPDAPFAEITHPSAGSNGGGALTGVGAIVDTGGQDDYIARDGQFGGVNGTNGGGWSLGGGAVGLAGDLDGANDTYIATAEDGPVTGANGGGSGYGQAPLAKAFTSTFDNINDIDDIQNNATSMNTSICSRAPTVCTAPVGPSLRATGTLVDQDGRSDTYRVTTTSSDLIENETVAGVNGGAFNSSSTGLLVDEDGADERYEVSSASNTQLGVNGGVKVALNQFDAPGAALLLDGDGQGDTYIDKRCGTETDDTHLPKGIAGAQIDRPVGDDTNGPMQCG